MSWGRPCFFTYLRKQFWDKGTAKRYKKLPNNKHNRLFIEITRSCTAPS